VNTRPANADGFLVVLSDVKFEDDRDYLNWLTTEHVQERLGIPGFLAVRIFRMPIAGGHRYLIWYRLENADVVDSEDYLERLNNPTPWSRRIMPILGNFGRGGGRVIGSLVGETGGQILTVELSGNPSDSLAVLSAVAAIPEIKSAHLLITDLKKSEVRTNERDLRTNNKSFDGLLIVEAESEKVLNNASALIFSLQRHATDSSAGGLYREVFSLVK
jgi:hypothetical protein